MTDPLRIALVHSTYWPEVRRGTERLVHDLGIALARRDHRVTVLTSHRGRTSTRLEEGMRVVRGWRPPRIRQLGAYEDGIESTMGAVARILADGYDLVHAFGPADGWASLLARRLGGPRVVCSFHGIPTRSFLVTRRYRLEIMQRIAREADAVSVLSEAAAEPYRRYLLRDPEILPGGVMCDRFAVDSPRAAAPTLVCAASLADPRKRGDLLMRTFARLRESVPDARLQVLRVADPIMGQLSPTLPEGASWVEGDDTGRLAALYASAGASILPAVEEAFGLVLLESLAAGTPVVAARSGACPEIVTSEAIGRLFDPDDDDGAVHAMEAALELGTRPETAAACRARATEFDWSTVVERYESTYSAVLGAG